MSAFAKQSPLATILKKQGASLIQIFGWEMAGSFGAHEAAALAEGALLVDWSHLTKLKIRGGHAAEVIARLDPGAADLPVGGSAVFGPSVVLRLVTDEFMVLAPPGHAEDLQAALADTRVQDVGAGLGILAMPGPRRFEVWERSTAVNLFPDGLAPGGVMQISVHAVHCTVYRTADFDLLMPGRDLAEFLFTALLDVGAGVGLAPGGLDIFPVRLT